MKSGGKCYFYRLEQQRDAVIERLAKTDSECALARRALYGKETDLRETQIDNELNQEKISRLQVQIDSMENVKAKIQRELFAREGELNRSQARERVAQKELAELRAELDYERVQNGKAKLDLEKQALKKACKHHKNKAETLSIQLDESKLGNVDISLPLLILSRCSASAIRIGRLERKISTQY